jgi:hypothetical protein
MWAIYSDWVQGLVFVVDAADRERLQEAFGEFQHMLKTSDKFTVRPDGRADPLQLSCVACVCVVVLVARISRWWCLRTRVIWTDTCLLLRFLQPSRTIAS